MAGELLVRPRRGPKSVRAGKKGLIVIVSSSGVFSYHLDLLGHRCHAWAMLYSVYLLLLAPLYSPLSILRLRDQEREILLLRQQLLILRRKLNRKPDYVRLEKLALLLAALRLSKRRLGQALCIT